MKNTTLCYIENDDAYLMLHRVKKENDLNKDKYVGVGGKFKENESPEECLLREVKEETGLTLTDYRLRGVVTFVSNEYEGEYMYLFTATGYEGDMITCDEGDLEWIPKKDVVNLPIWEGDKVFFKLLDTTDSFFTLKLTYEFDKLIDVQKHIW